MIQVMLPAPLCELAQVSSPLQLDVSSGASQRDLLDALEARYPVLRGTIRDLATGKRRAYLRFFACSRDISDADPDEPLPTAVCEGAEPFMVVGAMSGG